MRHQKLSDQYQKWIISYKSDQFSKAMFFVWLTDTSSEEEEDLIIVDSNNKIVTSAAKPDLITKVMNSLDEYPDHKQTQKWLAESKKIRSLAHTNYNLQGLGFKLAHNNLQIDDYEAIADFINLYEDFGVQLGGVKETLPSRTKDLIAIWEFYYKQIFYPVFHEQKDISLKDLPKLEADYKQLAQDFETIRKDFENNFQI